MFSTPITHLPGDFFLEISPSCLHHHLLCSTGPCPLADKQAELTLIWAIPPLVIYFIFLYHLLCLLFFFSKPVGYVQYIFSSPTPSWTHPQTGWNPYRANSLPWLTMSAILQDQINAFYTLTFLKWFILSQTVFSRLVVKLFLQNIMSLGFWETTLSWLISWHVDYSFSALFADSFSPT